MAKEKICKNCGKTVDSKAVICTECGAKIKNPIYKKWWFWVIVAVVVIGIGSSGDNGSVSNNPNKNNTDIQNEQPHQAEKAIEYTPYSVSDLVDDLESNALKAEEKYKNKYVELTGELRVIDSDGKYITLSPTNNEFTFTTVQCNIKNAEQKSRVAALSKGDSVTVRGKIKSIGEVLGYSLDIDSIN